VKIIKAENCGKPDLTFLGVSSGKQVPNEEWQKGREKDCKNGKLFEKLKSHARLLPLF
jgi:hypothetical protein